MNILHFPAMRMLTLILCKVLLKLNINICWLLLLKINLLIFCGLFWIFFFVSLNLRGHKESAEEEILYSSQPAEGKCHFLQFSQLHLLISQFRFIQPRDFFYSRLYARKDYFFFKATSFSVSSYLQSPN